MADLFDIRENFFANPYTVKNVQQDFKGWRQGRLRYAFWAIDVDVSSVRDQVFIANSHLEEFMLPQYRRQPHITLGISGFLSDTALYADDYAAESFEADLVALRSLQLKPFRVEIGNLASFGSAPFLCVRDDDNHLNRLHRCLHRIGNDAAFKYVPHVTVGLYAEAWSTALVGRFLDVFSQHHVTHHLVNRISLMSYMAAEIGGELTKIADYDLAHSAIEWYELPPFDPDYCKA